MDLTFLIAFIVAPLVAGQLGERCAVSIDATKPNFLPHPANCSKFFSCGSGIYEEMECPARLHYSDEKKICDWPSLADCKVNKNGHQVPMLPDQVESPTGAKPGEKCVPSNIRNNPRIAPFPGDCSKFLICTRVWVKMHCPRGLLFSVETSHCEFPENAKCCPTCNGPTLPTCFEEGLRLPNPTDCHKFYFCNNGTLLDLTCADGLVYSVYKRDCVKGTSCNELQLPVSPDENTARCSEENILYPNFTDCSKFFICNGGTLVDQSCPPHKFFSVNHKNCQLKHIAVCANLK